MLAWSWREYFSSFKTVSSNVLTNRHKTKHPLRLSEHAIIYAHSRMASKGKIACISPKRVLKMFSQKVRSEDSTLSLTSITYLHNFSPRLDSLADYSVVMTASPCALHPVALSTQMKTLPCKAESCLKIRGSKSKHSDDLTLCGSNNYFSKHN